MFSSPLLDHAIPSAQNLGQAAGISLRQWHEVASPRRRPGGQVRAGRANAQQDAGAAVTTDLGMGMGPPGCFPTNFWVGV